MDLYKIISDYPDIGSIIFNEHLKGNKIEQIKLLRCRYNLGLKEAKDIIDSAYDSNIMNDVKQCGIDIINKYKNSKPEDVLTDKELNDGVKYLILSSVFNYSSNEIKELLKTANRAEREAKLKSVKRNLSKKMKELYNDIPSDDNRKPIPDDVKDVVWRRDNGKCVRCGSQENLEFDHVIPVSKGGSNTARNIQILCEKCNREKSDNIG